MADKYRIVRGYDIDGKTHWVKVGTMKRPQSGKGWSITMYHSDVRFMAYPDEEKDNDQSDVDHQHDNDSPSPFDDSPIPRGNGGGAKPEEGRSHPTKQAPAAFDNSNLTEAQKGVVKVAKKGTNDLQNVWQSYDKEEKIALGGKPFLDWMKEIATQSDLGDKFDDFGNIMTGLEGG